jgi:lactoylglutathione lyase
MHINHIACWTQNLERLADFYTRYFGAEIQPVYQNKAKQFTSRFLVFPGGSRIEIMNRPDIQSRSTDEPHIGYVHVAFSVGSKEAVDHLTEQLRADGFTPIDGPRWTGDGYYESTILDPDGNRIEITL